MKYFVYIIHSKSADRFYIGYSSDITNRVAKHNFGSTPSTRPYIPWELVYFEEYSTKAEAIIREKEIKSKKSRKYIESLIQSYNG